LHYIGKYPQLDYTIRSEFVVNLINIAFLPLSSI